MNSLQYFTLHNTTIDTTGKLHETTFTENYAVIDGLVKLHISLRSWERCKESPKLLQQTGRLLIIRRSFDIFLKQVNQGLELSYNFCGLFEA